MRPCDVVLLSTADFDHPFWTNKQHVAVQLAARGFRVLYIDSLGLRRPSTSAQDVRRIGRRLRRAITGPRTVRPGLYVWSPLVLPFQKHALVRACNRGALSMALARQVRRLGFERPLLWTYNPLTTRLLRTDGFAGVVYHCVDDISAQPGMPAGVLDRFEEELVRAADIVFTTSPRLAHTRGRWNANTHYLPNVADFEHFSRALDPALDVPADLARIAGPRIGFVGAISGYKLDFSLIRHIAEQRPDWSLVLIGHIGEGDPWTDAAQLAGLPNLHLLGPRPYADLPAYLRGIDVAMLPNARNDYTASMFPMKFFEYLAAGRPVVSVDLPALRDYADMARLAGSPGAFVDAIAASLRGEHAPLEKRLALARQNTWAARLDRMMTLLETTPARTGARPAAAARHARASDVSASPVASLSVPRPDRAA